MVTEKRGDRRVLSISPELFIEFCKRHDDRRRTYTVENPLPDDARIVGGKIVWDRGNTIKVILESAEWEDFGLDTVEDLPSPEITVYLLENEEE